MPSFAKIILFAGLVPAFFTGCANHDTMKTERSQLIAKLNGEMHAQTGWLRIHAAEALLDNGESAGIGELFRPEAATAIAPYRIGVWRVMARSTSGEARARFIEQIRAVLHNPQAADRVSAAESLGKLAAADPNDREIISRWLLDADDATAVFPRWLLVLSSAGKDRETNESGLVKLLTSPDAVARLRAGFVFGRLKTISPDSIAALRHGLNLEPADSIARVYLITALLLHVNDATASAALEKQLLPYLRGKANEQLEAGIVIGLMGQKEGLALLRPLLDNREPDARIGAANGMLRLLP
jgi:hypothetical protein